MWWIHRGGRVWEQRLGAFAKQSIQPHGPDNNTKNSRVSFQSYQRKSDMGTLVLNPTTKFTVYFDRPRRVECGMPLCCTVSCQATMCVLHQQTWRRPIKKYMGWDDSFESLVHAFLMSCLHFFFSFLSGECPWRNKGRKRWLERCWLLYKH